MSSLQLPEKYRMRIERVLDDVLPKDDISPSRLHEAMRYSALAGGKRIRPGLVYASGQALDVPRLHLISLVSRLQVYLREIS